MKILDAAAKPSPYDRDVLSALAHYKTQAGERDQALAYVGQLREIDPENSEYTQMAKQIEGAPGPGGGSQSRGRPP